jgi:hypothetical protein
MIFLGLTDAEKDAEIARYVAAHGVRRVVLLSPAKFRFACSAPNHEWIEWAEVILYKFYYRLLQEIDRSSLVVVNECLRLQNRHDLTYNCMRLFLQQAGHQLVFQHLPLIDTVEDFMILFDFETRSRWKREPFSPSLMKQAKIVIRPVEIVLREVPVLTDEATRATYAREKRRLIDEIGLRDPHTIPRNLHLVAGRAKLAHVEPGRSYVGRNDRFKLDDMATYKEPAYPRPPYVVFEWPHNFIDFADVAALSRQTTFDVLVSDLKVDGWYFQRYRAWAERLRDAYAVLRQ